MPSMFSASVAHFVETVGELDATGLAATTRVDLGLDHPLRSADLFLAAWTASSAVVANSPLGTGMPYSANSVLGLVLMKIHSLESCSDLIECDPSRAPRRMRSALGRKAPATAYSRTHADQLSTGRKRIR